jgi:MFS family permease
VYSSQTKAKVFVLEGLNSLAATYYFYYLFFFMREEFGFGDFANLTLCAANGFIYVFAAWYGGRFAQRHGYFTALRLGFSLMALALAAGTQATSVPAHVGVMSVWTIGVCFTWPTLEAMVSENEPRPRLQRMVGIYNVVWAGVNAFAYFTGGAMLDHFGPRSIFWVPIGLHVISMLLLLRTETEVRNLGGRSVPVLLRPAPDPPPSACARSPVSSRTFLRMAWIANPFAYIAINAAVPVIPRLAERLNLSPTQAGFLCSIWFFARAATFVWLWLWPGWHYRFRFLAGAYGGMVISFAVILLVPNLFAICVAQIVFGVALGLIYYSSLFYSMDVGDTKGEHGGLHEAAIGFGIFAGPAVGASALHFVPGLPHINAWAVSFLLVMGFCLLLYLRYKPIAKRTHRWAGSAIVE